MAPAKKKATKSGMPSPAKKKARTDSALMATIEKAPAAQDVNIEEEPKRIAPAKSDPILPEAVVSNVPGNRTSMKERTNLHLLALPPDMFLYMLNFLVGAVTIHYHHNSWNTIGLKGFSLQNFSGLALVSKDFSRAWELISYAPIAAHTVNSDAAARVMRKLGARLVKLDLSVWYDSADDDLAVFASTLRGSARQPLNLVDICPKLKILTLKPFSFSDDEDDDDSLWTLPGASTACNLDALGTVPLALFIQCHHIRPKGTFRSFKCIKFSQFGDDLAVKDFKKTRRFFLGMLTRLTMMQVGSIYLT